MPRYSDNTLLQKAIQPALDDRAAMIDALGPDTAAIAEVQAECAAIEALRGKKLAKLTPAEQQAARMTFIYAEQQEQGYAAAKPGQPYEDAARKKASSFREVRLRLWGRTTLERLQEEGHAISIEEFLKRPD